MPSGELSNFCFPVNHPFYYGEPSFIGSFFSVIILFSPIKVAFERSMSPNFGVVSIIFSLPQLKVLVRSKVYCYDGLPCLFSPEPFLILRPHIYSTPTGFHIQF